MRLLGKCFHKKIEYDKKLCLNENSIGLTEGIKIEYKYALEVNSLYTATACYKIVSRLLPLSTSTVFQMRNPSINLRDQNPHNNCVLLPNSIFPHHRLIFFEAGAPTMQYK